MLSIPMLVCVKYTCVVVLPVVYVHPNSHLRIELDDFCGGCMILFVAVSGYLSSSGTILGCMFFVSNYDRIV